jgi:hypothetical protein
MPLSGKMPSEDTSAEEAIVISTYFRAGANARTNANANANSRASAHTSAVANARANASALAHTVAAPMPVKDLW